MGYEDWKWEYGEWPHELGTAEAGWLAFGEWEFTAAAWGEWDKVGNVDIYVVEYGYLATIYSADKTPSNTQQRWLSRD